MAITLTEVNGIAAAIVSLKQTKRTFSMEDYERIQKLIYDHSNYKGFIVPPDNHDGRNSQKYLSEHEEIIKLTYQVSLLKKELDELKKKNER